MFAVLSMNCREFRLTVRRQAIICSWRYLVELRWMKHSKGNERGSPLVRLNVGTVQPASVSAATHIPGDFGTVSIENKALTFPDTPAEAQTPTLLAIKVVRFWWVYPLSPT